MNDGNADAKADGPNGDGKMMPCPMAHEMLARMKMPTQMADASAVKSELMSEALMVMLLSMTMSYLMLLTKLTRCLLMTDDLQSYFTLIWMDPPLLTDVLIDDVAR